MTEKRKGRGISSLQFQIGRLKQYVASYGWILLMYRFIFILLKIHVVRVSNKCTTVISESYQGVPLLIAYNVSKDFRNNKRHVNRVGLCILLIMGHTNCNSHEWKILAGINIMQTRFSSRAFEEKCDYTCILLKISLRSDIF